MQSVFLCDLLGVADESSNSTYLCAGQCDAQKLHSVCQDNGQASLELKCSGYLSVAGFLQWSHFAAKGGGLEFIVSAKLALNTGRRRKERTRSPNVSP